VHWRSWSLTEGFVPSASATSCLITWIRFAVSDAVIAHLAGFMLGLRTRLLAVAVLVVTAVLSFALASSRQGKT
jgi:hypothetical protein